MHLTVLLGSDCFAFPEPRSISIKANVGFVQHAVGCVKEKLRLSLWFIISLFTGKKLLFKNQAETGEAETLVRGSGTPFISHKVCGLLLPRVRKRSMKFCPTVFFSLLGACSGH